MTNLSQNVVDLIYATHVHADEYFDGDSQFIIVENILKRATQTVDKFVQGSHVENIEERIPKSNFSVPLCKIKQIGRKLSCCSCKTPSDDVAQKTTLSILNKLSTYSWETKAVLTLAAFAMEYCDFWLLAQLQHSDSLAKSVGMLKRVPIHTKPLELKKRQAVLELNNLIKATLQVVDIFNEFDQLSNYDPKDIQELSVEMGDIPVDVYWTTLTIVACSTKLAILTSDEPDKPHDLSPYSQKIHTIINKLKIKLVECRRQLEEAETYRKLLKSIRTRTQVTEVFKALIFTQDKPQTLIDGSTEKTVNIDVLRGKNVFIFISTLEITGKDISILKPIYEGTKKDDRYKIVWLPMVEEWTIELQKKFETLRFKMPWLIIQSVSHSLKVGIKFIKERWHFKGQPTVVLMNPQGKVENPDALHLIRLWGMKAFPFNKAAEETISKELSLIVPVVIDLDPVIETWVKEEKYIFFYGGKDNGWIKEFTERATALANDRVIKESKIKMEMFCMGKNAKEGEGHGILGQFWSGIESLFFIKFHKPLDPVTQDIQKLLSYKNERGWAVLCKGSTVIIVGHGVTVLGVLEDFKKWKEDVKDKSFEFCFKKQYKDRVVHTGNPCCRLDIPSAIGEPPEKMKCPECPRTMEMLISYKCCHRDGPANAHH